MNKQMIMVFGGAIALIGIVTAAIMILVPKPNQIVKCANFSLNAFAQSEGKAPDPDYYVRTVGLCAKTVVDSHNGDRQDAVADLIEAFQQLGWWDPMGQRFVPQWRQMDEVARFNAVRRGMVPHMSIIESESFNLIMHQKEVQDDGTIVMEYEVESGGHGLQFGRLNVILRPIEEPDVEPQNRRYYELVSLSG